MQDSRLCARFAISEIGDRLFDGIADLVDLGVDFLLPVEEVAVSGLFDGSEHVVADVAFVAQPVLGVVWQKNLGRAQAVRVMPAARDRVGDSGEVAVERADDLHVDASGIVLAAIQFWMRGP